LTATRRRIAPLVGREAESKSVNEALSATQRRKGGALLVAGPAGIGKSRLIASALAAASARGFTTGSAANFAHVRSPLGPIADLVRELRTGLPDFVPKATLDRELFDCLCGAAPSQTAAAGWDRRRLFVIVAAALERSAERTPLALSIDDVQWLDPESLEFLTYLVPRLDRMRVLVFLGLREDETTAETAPDAAAALERFPQTSTMRLEPLADLAVRELLLANVSDGQTIPGRLLDEICRRSEGNPLFVEELAREVSAHGAEAKLPRSAQQAARRRLDALGNPAARVVEVAAALGRSFALDAVVQALNADRETVVAALRAARDAGLIREADDQGERFAFQHELIRAAIYDRMLEAERRAIHRRIAEHYESLPGDSIDAATLAYHWVGAHDAERATYYSERAGDDAMALTAAASARDRFLEALETGALDAAGRARVAEKLALAFDQIGDATASLDRLREALQVHRDNMAERDEIRVELRLAGVAYRCGRVDEAISACETALQAASLSPAERVAAHTSLATYYSHRGDVPAASREIALADADNDAAMPLDQIRLEWVRANTAMHSQGTVPWLPPAQRAVHLAEKYAPPTTLVYTLMSFASLADENGHDELAQVALDRSITVADANGLTFAAAYARCDRILKLHFHGRLAEAYATLSEVVALQVGAVITRVFAAANGIPILLELDRRADYPSLFDPELLEAAMRTGEAGRFAPLAAAHVEDRIASDRSDEARNLIHTIVARLDSPHYIGRALCVFARYGELEDAQRVRALISEAKPVGRTRLYKLMIEAFVAKHSGEDSRAISRLWRDVAELAGKMNAPLCEATALEELSLKREALAIYAASGAVARMRALSGKSAALSRRESEIAAFIADGLSNRSIAEKLVLSERTVEHHAASIYAKLGVKSRSEFISLRRG
jgi:DNA-binding NarL/FixJ family response regulator